MAFEVTALFTHNKFRFILKALFFCQVLALRCQGDEPRTWHEGVPQGPRGTCSVETWKTNFPGQGRNWEIRYAVPGNAVNDFNQVIFKNSSVATFVRTWMEAPSSHILTNVATNDRSRR
jgi:hypothetical protein